VRLQSAVIQKGCEVQLCSPSAAHKLLTMGRVHAMALLARTERACSVCCSFQPAKPLAASPLNLMLLRLGLVLERTEYYLNLFPLVVPLLLFSFSLKCTYSF